MFGIHHEILKTKYRALESLRKYAYGCIPDAVSGASEIRKRYALHIDQSDIHLQIAFTPVRTMQMSDIATLDWADMVGLLPVEKGCPIDVIMVRCVWVDEDHVPSFYIPPLYKPLASCRWAGESNEGVRGDDRTMSIQDRLETDMDLREDVEAVRQMTRRMLQQQLDRCFMASRYARGTVAVRDIGPNAVLRGA